MRILFWNTNGNKHINSYIVNLVSDYRADVLVLAEYRSDAEELYNLLDENGTPLLKCNTLGCERIDIWSNYAKIESGLQDSYYSIQIISNEYIICVIQTYIKSKPFRGNTKATTNTV